MIEMKGVRLSDICRELIAEKFQMYFSAAALVDEIVAVAHNVPVKVVLNGSKADFNKYGKDKRSIRHRIISILKMLENRGEITRYSKYTWKKVKT